MWREQTTLAAETLDDAKSAATIHERLLAELPADPTSTSALRGCGDSFGPGNVKLRVKVTASGEVGSVKVLETPSPGLGKCVAKKTEALTFPATISGGSFDYLFPVR